METHIYNIETFLEIKKNYVVNNTEIETLFNTLFNLKKKKYILNKSFQLPKGKKTNLLVILIK